jgi:hypothetical protein
MTLEKLGAREKVLARFCLIEFGEELARLVFVGSPRWMFELTKREAVGAFEWS